MISTATAAQPAFPPRVEIQRLSLASHQTDVAVSGAGDDAVILLHAIGIDRQVWAAVAAWLPACVRAVAVDLHGFGSAAASPPASMDDHATDLADVLDQLGIERAHVAGVSYGGAVALTFALRHPERVASLGVAASLARAPAEVFEQRARLAEESGPDAYVEPTIERWFTAEERAVRSAPVRYVNDCLRRTPVASWARGWRVLGAVDILDDLGSITCPATVVAGELDTSCTPASMQQIAERLGDATFHVLRGAAHMLPLEQPFALARHLYAGTRRSPQIVRR